jgi:hypothetical protein
MILSQQPMPSTVRCCALSVSCRLCNPRILVRILRVRQIKLASSNGYPYLVACVRFVPRYRVMFSLPAALVIQLPLWS